MNKKGLTITMIFQAQSLNYGEGIGNIAELKKLSRGDGSVYSFASRQALRYDIARLGNKFFDWNLDVVDKTKGTVQFKENLTIKDSEEMDLFGYMKTIKKTEKKSTDSENEGNENDNSGSDVRSAAVRLSHAISLESYKSDMEFLNNKGLADRIKEHPNLANVEQHLSYYTYTLTIDLEKVGIDKNITLSSEEKIKRVNQLLEIIKVLNREIRGREENLSPLFAIGGLYNINTPFFMGRVKLDVQNGEYSINTNILKDTASLKFGDENILDNTYVGIVGETFKNEAQIKEVFSNKTFNIQEFFDNLKKQVEECYN